MPDCSILFSKDQLFHVKRASGTHHSQVMKISSMPSESISIKDHHTNG